MTSRENKGHRQSGSGRGFPAQLVPKLDASPFPLPPVSAPVIADMASSASCLHVSWGLNVGMGRGKALPRHGERSQESERDRARGCGGRMTGKASCRG